MPKAKNNPKPTIDDVCEICGAPYAAFHEIFFGTANRQKSIKWGMQKRLCCFHHNDQSNRASNPHYNKRVDQNLREEYQERFEAQRVCEGMTASDARKLFMAEFGRNYLDD